MKAKADLFRDEFKDTLMKKVEADSALSKAVNIVSKSSVSANKMYQRVSGSLFVGSRNSWYGAASGNVYQPYNRYQGKENRPRTSLTTKEAVSFTNSDQTIPTETRQTASKTSKGLATGREAAALCASMGAAHAGSMDPGDHPRLQHSLPQTAFCQTDPSLYLYRNRERGTVSRGRNQTKSSPPPLI